MGYVKTSNFSFSFTVDEPGPGTYRVQSEFGYYNPNEHHDLIYATAGSQN